MGQDIPSLFSMLDELIGVASVSSTSAQKDMGNLLVINKLADWLTTLGFQCQIMPVNGLYSSHKKANLIATLGSGTDGLVLSGHTDTVPFDEALWSVDPLRLTQRDNKLFGLGATDMKGFFPIAIEAAKTFIDKPLQHPLIIVATADEESSMAGARQLVSQQAVQAKYAVIGEPTNLKPIRMHKGMMMESVIVEGRAGHSSNPALGNNALEAMHVVIADLLTFRTQLQQRHQNVLFDINVPTLNLGCIHGGDNPNRICGQCELHFDLRALPGMNNSDLQTEIAQRLEPLAKRFAVNIKLRSLIESIAPFDQAADSQLVKMAEQLTHCQAKSVAFATEGSLLQQLGMETIVLGPGCIDQAHQPDEFMSLNQVQPAIDIYKHLIAKFCL